MAPKSEPQDCSTRRTCHLTLTKGVQTWSGEGMRIGRPDAGNRYAHAACRKAMVGGNTPSGYCPCTCRVNAHSGGCMVGVSEIESDEIRIHNLNIGVVSRAFFPTIKPPIFKNSGPNLAGLSGRSGWLGLVPGWLGNQPLSKIFRPHLDSRTTSPGPTVLGGSGWF